MTEVWVSEHLNCLMACASPVAQVELSVPYDNWNCHFYLLRDCLQQEGTAVQSCASCCQSRGVNEESVDGRNQAHSVQGRAAHCILLFLLLAEQPCRIPRAAPRLPLAALPTCVPSAGVPTAGTVCCKLSRPSSSPALLFDSKNKWSLMLSRLQRDQIIILLEGHPCWERLFHHADGLATCSSS